jgi:hypothetical protein
VNPRYPVVAEGAAHRCEYCHAPEAIFNFSFEVEHIIPRLHGGSDTAGNWALACRGCNLAKRDYLEGLDPETQAAVRLFHPRQDYWDEHFGFVPATGTLQGLTAIGRATVGRLQMNAPAQLAARQQWRRLGLFP